MKPALADVVCEIYESGLLGPEDLDDRAVDIINSVNLDQAKFIFTEIKNSELFGVATKSLYVTSLIRSFKDRCRQQGAAAVTSGKLINGPELAALKNLLETTGYTIEVTIGQRKFGGPPPDWEGPATGPAGQGHEVEARGTTKMRSGSGFNANFPEEIRYNDALRRVVLPFFMCAIELFRQFLPFLFKVYRFCLIISFFSYF